MISKVDAAVEYARLGWKVFPLHSIKHGVCTCGNTQCTSPGKHPRVSRAEGGRGLDDGTSDEETVRTWWKLFPDANIGIATGEFSNLFVVDLDGEAGENSWFDLVGAYGPCDYLQARTGSGGRHLLFKYPKGLELGNTAGRLGKGIDTRGQRGYIVAPPSLHISGGKYEWIDLPPNHVINGDFLKLPPKWLIAELEKEDRLVAPNKTDKVSNDDVANAQHWLDKAVFKATAGSRNNTGFWLATQLRDAGVPIDIAATTMQRYVDRVHDMGNPPYTWSEASASLTSAYKTSPRERALSRDWRPQCSTPICDTQKQSPQPPKPDTAEELKRWMTGVESGKIQNVPWRAPILTHLTQALLPGSLVTVVGDPGVGKTFFGTDSMIYWDQIGVPFAAFMLEKNRRFYAQRILAQLAGDGRITTYADIVRHPDIWRAALDEHRDTVARIGKSVFTRERNIRYTPTVVGNLIERAAKEGARVIYVDPVTAMIKGREPWNEEQDFVQDRCQAIAEDYACSIVFVTHPVKERPMKGSPSGHSAAGGAAWFRFVDTQLWLQREDPPLDYRYQSLNNGIQHGSCDVMATAIKTRDGSGGGRRFMFNFEKLRYRELGIVLGETGKESRRELSPDELGPDAGTDDGGNEYGL